MAGFFDIVGISGSQMFFWLFMFVLFIIILGIIAFGVYMFTIKKRYEKYDCYIYEKDNFGNLNVVKDQGGEFKTRKFGNGFYLRFAKTRLDPKNLSYISGKKKRIVHLLKKEKSYTFLRPKLNSDNFELSITTEDTTWAIDAIKEGDKLTNSNSIWPQVVSFMIIAVPSIFILVLFIFVFQKTEVILDTLAPVMQNAIQSNVIQ